LPPDDEIILEDNCFYDSSRNLILKIPVWQFVF
jgi:hypothetical protein